MNYNYLNYKFFIFKINIVIFQSILTTYLYIKLEKNNDSIKLIGL